MPVQRSLPANFPTKPVRPNIGNVKMFPQDLRADGRNMYTQIQMIPYNGLSLATTNQPTANPIGGIVLPIPQKVNSVQPVIWQESSIMDNLTQGAMNALWTRFNNSANASTVLRGQRWFNAITSGAQATGTLASVISGFQVNPMLWMMFRAPGFREFTLNWQFIANNEQESQIILEIRDYIHFHMLPQKRAGGLLYQYPNIALIRFYPVADFTVRFKPCAVLGFEVDYTGGGVPSFNKDGTATVINVSMVVKEIDLLTKDTYYL